MAMNWLNLPIIYAAFFIGLVSGVLIGACCMYGIDCLTAYVNGYRHGKGRGGEDE